MGNKKKRVKVDKRTFSSKFKIINNGTKNIFDFMTHESKNAYNSFIYTTNLYYKFKKCIFCNAIKEIKSLKKVSEKIVDDVVYKHFQVYYDLYSKEKKHFNNNNDIIYKFIKENLKEKIINSNLNSYKNQFITLLYKNKELYLNKELNMYLIDDIIINILNSFYNKNFNYVKDCLLNHKPINDFDDNFIKEVKNENNLLNCSIKNSEKTDIDFKIYIMHNNTLHGNLYEFSSNFVKGGL